MISDVRVSRSGADRILCARTVDDVRQTLLRLQADWRTYHGKGPEKIQSRSDEAKSKGCRNEDESTEIYGIPRLRRTDSIAVQSEAKEMSDVNAGTLDPCCETVRVGFAPVWSLPPDLP